VVDLFTDERIDCETYIQTRDYLTAEIAKEAHNAFFATKVTFANQMRLICEQEGADVGAVMSVVTADERNTTSHLDPYLGPYGGKCLPKDTEALTLYGDHQGADVNLLEAVMDLNATVAERYENREIEGNWPNLSVSGD
jgi:UDPglucose 6-dehydrogenase